jgi:hypothetical protein
MLRFCLEIFKKKMMHNRVDGPPTNPSFVNLPPHLGTKF